MSNRSSVTRTAWKVVVALWIAFFVWTVSVNGSTDGAAPPVLPEILPDVATTPAEEAKTQFSLDLTVINTADHDVIYAVEQRARPGYRIFAFDPATGTEQTVFTVPKDAIIYGIALNSTRDQLAVAYTPDFNLGGAGLSLLDLTSGELTEIIATTEDVYLTEPEWSSDRQSVFVTHVDRRGEDEELALAEVDITRGEVEIVIRDGITPAVQDDDLFYLAVADDNARRSVGVLDASGQTTVISVGDNQYDLDHLVAGPGTDTAHVAVLDPVDTSTLTFGTAADAHGNHNLRSTWWSLNHDPSPIDIDGATVYDAEVSPSGAIIYATVEGLSIARDQRVDLIKSRAIRFVAA